MWILWPQGPKKFQISEFKCSVDVLKIQNIWALVGSYHLVNRITISSHSYTLGIAFERKQCIWTFRCWIETSNAQQMHCWRLNTCFWDLRCIIWTFRLCIWTFRSCIWTFRSRIWTCCCCCCGCCCCCCLYWCQLGVLELIIITSLLRSLLKCVKRV